MHFSSTLDPSSLETSGWRVCGVSLQAGKKKKPPAHVNAGGARLYEVTCVDMFDFTFHRLLEAAF